MLALDGVSPDRREVPTELESSEPLSGGEPASGEEGGDSPASVSVELLGARRAWWRGSHIWTVIWRNRGGDIRC
jgi:hypothetical protein